MKKKIENGEECTANCLDGYIGIYYANKHYREAGTLGHFLAPILRELAPDIVGVYLSGKELLDDKK